MLEKTLMYPYDNNKIPLELIEVHRPIKNKARGLSTFLYPCSFKKIKVS